MKFNSHSLLQEFISKYKSGIDFIPLNSTSVIDILNNSKSLQKLIDNGFVQKRDCEGTAYELTNSEKLKITAQN